MKQWHTVKIASKLGFISEVEGRVLEELRNRGLSEKQVFSVRLALEEAVANAIKHGNKMDSSKTVTVRYLIGDADVVIEVSDEGGGFDASGVPDPTRPERLELPHGRGVMLMRAYMDRVEYNEKGNTVRMTFSTRQRTPEAGEVHS